MVLGWLIEKRFYICTHITTTLKHNIMELYSKSKRQVNRMPKNISKSQKLLVKKHSNKMIKETSKRKDLLPEVKAILIAFYKETKVKYSAK